MNKNDFKLIFGIIIICLIFIIIMNFIPKNQAKIAKIYHNNELVLKIDLSLKENKKYVVDGDKGKVKIVTKNGKIKVEEENSDLHLCSKQGYIENTYETIICLPNKVVIEIEGKKKDIDTVIK